MFDMSCVKMSPDGRFAASVSTFEEYWTLWDAASGIECMTADSHDGTGACICRRSLNKECPLKGHISGPLAMAFSPCGRRLATGGENCAVILWDCGTGKAEHVMQGDIQRKTTVKFSEERVTSISFSADGARLASGSLDRFVRVWNTTTGELLRTIPRPHGDQGFGVSFCPTDSRRVSASNKSGSNVWDIDSGEMVSSFEGQRFALLSTDGRLLAGSIERTIDSRLGNSDVQLVGAESGALLLSMPGHYGPVYSLSFSVNHAP